MNTYSKLNLDDIRLSQTSRIIRLAIGAMLIAIPMTHGGALGALAILPLLAIYPVLTGILGFGLVELLVANNQSRTKHQSPQVNVARSSLFIVGTGLIAFVMGSATAPAWLALVAIVPILMAILGSDIVGKALLTRRTLQVMNKTGATIVHAQTSSMPGQGNVFEQHNPKQAA